ncbi:hypothetical protein [Methylocystis echinoides]|uniref:EexN family lipoprotein n=1 Tax=Methylocystis echinoides TaxID=29468 RepID=A0A9W6LRR4_9HYPH|nr:hypothetical protein [Methylocystis echinoides]GLI92722.1 hypothetical protein LMG27198_17140 [Methylocystis echinoides]
MRYLAFALMFALSACNSAQSVKEAANREYAVDSYEQSLQAYQLCAERNAGDPQKCSALSRVIEADRKRYEKTAGGL